MCYAQANSSHFFRRENSSLKSRAEQYAVVPALLFRRHKQLESQSVDLAIHYR